MATNYLKNTEFKLFIDNAKGVSFTCQSPTLPSVTVTEIKRSNPFGNISYPGTKLDYEPFAITFLVDEKLRNYNEILDWMVKNSGVDKTEIEPNTKSDGTLIVYSSSSNEIGHFTFKDMYPISLSDIPFDAKLSETQYVTATVTFHYRNFKYTSS